MTSITYRQATIFPTEYESFEDVELKCFGENYYSYYEFASIVSQGLTYIAEKDNQMIGYIMCINEDFKEYTDDDEYELIQSSLKNKENKSCIKSIRSGEDKKYIHIFGFGVLTQYRGMGVGSVLMEKVMNLQKEKKQSIILEVRISNINAIKLYKKFGFETVTTIPNYYRDNNEAGYLFIRPYRRFKKIMIIKH